MSAIATIAIAATASSASAASAAAAATATITIKLLTGDLMVVEVRQEETYYSLYHRVLEALPQEIRPASVGQLNLMLDGELVPMSHAPYRGASCPHLQGGMSHAPVSYLQGEESDETYHLLIDSTQYVVRVQGRLYQAIDLPQDLPVRNTYTVLNVQVEEKTGFDFKEKMSIPVLYEPNTHQYYDLDGVEQEWIQWRNDEELGVYLTHANPSLSDVGMIDLMMERMEKKLSPSLAMLRAMRKALEDEVTGMEERNPSWADFNADGEEEDADYEEYARWAGQGGWADDDE